MWHRRISLCSHKKSQATKFNSASLTRTMLKSYGFFNNNICSNCKMPVNSGWKNFTIQLMPAIDINCDMGEGIGNDEMIMPFISSANIACGYHAGNETIMRQTIELAQKNNVV